MSHLIELMADLKEEEVYTLVDDQINRGVEPINILDQARAAMEIVGWRFETEEYFIPDLVLAGEILKVISEKAKPFLKKRKAVKRRARLSSAPWQETSMTSGRASLPLCWM